MSRKIWTRNQFTNQATSNVAVNGTNFNFTSNPVTAQLFDLTSVTLVKTQSLDLVVLGGKNSYTVIITNLSTTALTNFTFVDAIPTGMAYSSKSFKINTAAATPTTSGQNLSYVFATLPIGPTTITFDCDVI